MAELAAQHERINAEPRPLSYQMKGYIFGKQRRYHIISKHGRTHKLQVLHLTDVQEQSDESHGDQIEHMKGILFDFEGHTQVYATRFIAWRYSDEKDLPEPGLVPFRALPEFIRRNLKDAIKTESRVAIF